LLNRCCISIGNWQSAIGNRNGTLALLQEDLTRIAKLTAWVKTGFVPQNPKKTHDSSDIGTIIPRDK
jgi:hypothetical protein